MKLFGRRPRRCVLGLKGVPLLISAFRRSLSLFERPLTVFRSYILRQSPPDRIVRFRDGRIIHLSEDPADIVTVFLIFAREDYGKVLPGSVVIDIGANIGAFALFAAFSGAKEVYAFEPSASSFEILLKNIRANGLDSFVCAKRLAVVGVPGGSVRFPRRSDVMNAILEDGNDPGDSDLVPTVTLSEIVRDLKPVDLLKSDCEGREYDIFLNSGEAEIRRVAEIRMEYHNGPRDELISRMVRLGYTLRQFMGEGSGGGYLWLTRNSIQ